MSVALRGARKLIGRSRAFVWQHGKRSELVRGASLPHANQAAVGEVEQIGSRRLINHIVTPPVRFDGVPSPWVPHRVPHESKLPVV